MVLLIHCLLQLHLFVDGSCLVLFCYAERSSVLDRVAVILLRMRELYA